MATTRLSEQTFSAVLNDTSPHDHSTTVELTEFCSTIILCGGPLSRQTSAIADDDMLHAVAQALTVEDLGEDPDRWLVIGPDQAANLLELVVLLTAEGDQMIIHAMPLRAEYRKLLDQ